MAEDKIGRFEILGEIARSSHACVYKATDESTGRTVALKAFELDIPGTDRQEVLGRLIQEAESTRNLSHQNIVLLYGAGEIDGRFCAAMEYVEGMSIAGTVAKGETFSIWDVLDISRQVCNALDHAHKMGVVHRRLQPANVLVGWDGTVKILGFGTSCMWAEEDVQSVPSPALCYMSPEEVRGEQATSLSNLFSWGAILYEMVTGRQAYQGATSEELRHQIQQGQPKSPTEILPRLHPGLSDLILKAIAKDPAERFQNSRELLDALESCKETPKAVAAKTPAATAKPAAQSLSQPGAPTKAQKKLSPYGVPINEVDEAPAPKWKAAAASAGTAATTAAVGEVSPSTIASTKPMARASATAVDEEVANPAAPNRTFAVDPAMATETSTSGARKSFSDVAELPPLKVQAPPPPPPVAEQPEPLPEIPMPVLRASARIEEKKGLTLPELPKIDPKLLIYGIGGGLAVVLLVVLGVSLYVHFHFTDDEGTVQPASAPIVKEVQAETATAPATPPAVEETPPAVQAEQVAESAPTPVVAPATKSRPGKRGKAEAMPVPVVIPGQLVVNSTPEGAEIRVDGKADSAWMTPFTLTGLTPGQHTLSVSKAGYLAETRTLDITSGTKSFLVMHLNPAGAIVNLTSDPAGASILLDGRDTGRVTPAQLTLDKGSHNLLIRKTGFLEESTTVELQAGQAFQYGPHLKALGSTEDIRTISKTRKLFGRGDTPDSMGRIMIRTNPKGAQIAVNQRIIDRTSPVEFALNPGTYVVDITYSGYKSLRRVINVEQGGRLTLDEKLDPQ